MAPNKFSSIALDLGTTSIKAGLLAGNGLLVNLVSRPTPTIIANDERYESDALAYAQTAEQVLVECLAQIGTAPPLGLCSQRSSFLLWERGSGLPVSPLISWQDLRGMLICEELQEAEGLISELGGLRLTPYYFAPKLASVLREHPEWQVQLERGELLVGTLDTFLIWRWTDGKHHVTDASMAARTLLMDLRQQQWSPALCALFGIPQCILPTITSSTALNLRLSSGLTLQASVGDQSAALIAAVGTEHKVALVNLGTGGFVLRFQSENEFPREGYLRTLIYQDGKQGAHIAIEGTLNSLAAALAPYPVGECRFEDSETFCLAEPSGIGAPYFIKKLGLYFSHPISQLSPSQIAALLLEGIIFRVARIVEDFHRSSPLERIYLAGGLSELAGLQQGIAQCVPCDVYRLRQKDASLLGAALLAAGLEPVCSMKADKIVVVRNTQHLPEKYMRWKSWLDGVLAAHGSR